MISFENTKIAFQSKSNSDLRKSYWLFRIVANPKFVRIGKWLTNVALKLRLPIKGIIKRTIFSQFCGGETIEESTNTIEKLTDFGIGSILDYSIEGKTTDKDFDSTVIEIIATIRKGKHNKYIPFAVFKITGISRFPLLEAANNGLEELSIEERAEYDLILGRVHAICQTAYECDVPIFVDAEESWIQNTIDRIAHEMMEYYNQEKAIVYNTIQMYRKDRLDFLKYEVADAALKGYKYGIKLVRGAYMEKERARAAENGYSSPIHEDKQATDAHFNTALRHCLERIEHLEICCGSHNEGSAILLTQLMGEFNIPKDDSRIYFAQLLGMSDHISFNIAHAGYNVAKYVPYGPVREVIPYLLRRANENTSVAGQTSRELSLIIRELYRRKEIKYTRKR